MPCLNTCSYISYSALFTWWFKQCSMCCVGKEQSIPAINIFGPGASLWVHESAVCSPHTVKSFWLLLPYLWYFGQLRCIPFMCMTHKVQGVLTIWTGSSWQPSIFYKISISFQKAYKFAFLLLWSYISAPGEFLAWLYGCGRNARNVAKKVLWIKRLELI